MLAMPKEGVSHSRTRIENSRVQMKAPTNPSTVFFGDNLINGVLPKVMPRVHG